MNRCVESRFQRWSIIRSESWGDAPGWYENALLALNRYTLTLSKRRVPLIHVIDVTFSSCMWADNPSLSKAEETGKLVAL